MTSSSVPWDIRDKVVVVTGGNAGIGKATVIELVRRGAIVHFTSRDEARGQTALKDIREAANGPGSGTVSVRQLDLASCDSIHTFASKMLDEVPVLHVLVHNAGMIQDPRDETADGFERTFGVNHLGTHLLNELLLPRVIESAPARIVVVASNAHTRMKNGLNFDDLQATSTYDAVEVYSASKFANILFARELSKRLVGTGVTANSLHPGVVATNFNQTNGAGGFWGFLFKYLRFVLSSPESGAKTSVHLCCEPSLSQTSGDYFDSCKATKPIAAAQDDVAAKRLWDVSDALWKPVLEKR